MEHVLSMMTVIYVIQYCESTKNPVDRFLEAYFVQVFVFFKYNRAIGIFGKFLNILSTFAWNFIDLFIMAVGFALSEKFRQINVNLQCSKYKVSFKKVSRKLIL